MIDNETFFHGKKVFITGHTGFKGAWLCMVLHYMGAEICGYALAPEEGSLFLKIGGSKLVRHVEGDVGDFEKLQNTLQDFQPELVIHLAAYGFVKECFNDPIQAYTSTVLGTANLLEAVRKSTSIKAVLVVSSDKVYLNDDSLQLFKETSPLGGLDPYSCSKTCEDLISQSYYKSYFESNERKLGFAIVRPSNVLGGGDHIKSRLLPSILDALDRGETPAIRNPHMTRPWQSILDALDAYLNVIKFACADPINCSGIYNIGPFPKGVRSVDWIVNYLQKQFFYENTSIENTKEYKKQEEVKESKNLGIEISKVEQRIGWRPRLSLERTLDELCDFYRKVKSGRPEYAICIEQIKRYYKK